MTLFTEKRKLASRAGETKNPHQPEPVLVLNLANQNLLSISDQGRGILEDTSRREAESGSVVKTAKKRGPQMRSLGFLFCPRGASECGLFYGQDMAPISCVAWRKFIPILLPSVRFSN